jgi:hypothetical protein
MVADTFFVKSLEDDFFTKTIEGGVKVQCQSIDEIVQTGVIRPNTKSFGKQSRLCTTILAPNYLKTYRSQGIIFFPKRAPCYIVPFDLVLLTDAKKPIVQYSRIKDNLQYHYNHRLIPGFDKFVFSNFEDLLRAFPTHKKVWSEITCFRTKAGLSPLPLTKYRLIEYNEAVFESEISIVPVAIFGRGTVPRQIAKKHNLPLYASAREFYISRQVDR